MWRKITYLDIPKDQEKRLSSLVVESKMLSHQINFVGDYQKLVLKLRSQNF
jgi:hypothetical protein